MKLGKKDLYFIAPVAVVLLVVLLTSGRDKAPSLPVDERHSGFSEKLAAGRSRVQVEEGCLACHGPQARPLSKNHPPKEQCLICHRKKAGGDFAARR
jgi:cbb3-type cytochrome oxidase cytochrome c subunit